MTLAAKLTVGIIVAVLIVMSANAIVRDRFERSSLATEAVSIQNAIGLSLIAAVDSVWRADGEERALRMIDEANQIETRVDIMWRWVDSARSSDTTTLPSSVDRTLLRRGAVISEVRTDSAGQPRRYSYVPFIHQRALLGVLEISQSLIDENRFLWRSRLILVVVTLGLIASCALSVSGATYWLVGRPMKRLRDAARRVGSGDLGARVALAGSDEVAELGREFDQMTERLAEATRVASEQTEARLSALEQLRHVDRLTTVGRIAAGVAHELGTPLNVISEHAEMIRDDEESGHDGATVILEQTARMTALIRQLLDFSRSSGIDPEIVDLRDPVRRSVTMLESLAERRRVELRVEMPGDPRWVRGDPLKLGQVFTNLIVNAIHATPAGGTIAVELTTPGSMPAPSPALDAGLCHRVRVSDTGTGIAPAHHDLIFEPFFTTKAVGEGTGLGLAVAQEIVREHGGHIEVESQAGAGSRFEVTLPAIEVAR